MVKTASCEGKIYTISFFFFYKNFFLELYKADQKLNLMSFILQTGFPQLLGVFALYDLISMTCHRGTLNKTIQLMYYELVLFYVVLLYVP